MSGDLGENAVGFTSKCDDIEAIRVAVTGVSRKYWIRPIVEDCEWGLFRKGTTSYSPATGDTPGNAKTRRRQDGIERLCIPVGSRYSLH